MLGQTLFFFSLVTLRCSVGVGSRCCRESQQLIVQKAVLRVKLFEQLRELRTSLRVHRDSLFDADASDADRCNSNSPIGAEQSLLIGGRGWDVPTDAVDRLLLERSSCIKDRLGAECSWNGWQFVPYPHGTPRVMNARSEGLSKAPSVHVCCSHEQE